MAIVGQLIRLVGLPPAAIAGSSLAVTSDDLTKLLALAKSPLYHVNIRRGYPTCPICGYSIAGELLEHGPFPEAVVLADVLLPWMDGFFVFPTILYHLCAIHDYRVSTGFLEGIRVASVDQIDDRAMKERFRRIETGTVG